MIDRKWLGLATAFVLFAAGACGTVGDASPGAQPTPNVTTFEAGVFDDLPRFPRSEPLGPRNEKKDVVARSFQARGTTPQQVLDYYRLNLAPPWTVVRAPEKLGVGTYRADWTNGDWQLRVSATEEPILDPDNASKDLTVQYSMTLSPLGEG
ncbi:MAG: hypothetical protein ACR2HM_11565 [Acidimicrobiales bacterium]